jgi:tetratricopeptide (TPR) repeat protein
MTHIKALARLNGDLERARTLENLDVRIRHLLNISQQFKTLQMYPRAKEVYDQALKLSQSMPDGYEKIEILLKLGCLQAALQMTRQCLNNARKAATLIDISHLIRQPAQLISLWREAIAVASEIVDISEREQSLAYVIKAVPKERDGLLLEQAIDLYHQAVQIAIQSIQNLECRNNVLYTLTFWASLPSDQKIQILNQNCVPLRSIDEDKKQYYDSMIKDCGESCLFDFQEQKQAEELYRFIYGFRFHPNLIIRVWSTKSSYPCLYITVKLGVQGWDEIFWILTEESSLSLLTAIDQNQFWDAFTWKLSDFPCSNMWLFEGWREGHYKILDAWSDDTTNGPAYQLGKNFLNLLPQNLLGFIKAY